MNTENVRETSSVTPSIAAEIPAPVAVPAIPADVVVDAEGTNDRRFGTRKIENVDGSVSYGLKTDGTPRKRPGRKPKAVS